MRGSAKPFGLERNYWPRWSWVVGSGGLPIPMYLKQAPGEWRWGSCWERRPECEAPTARRKDGRRLERVAGDRAIPWKKVLCIRLNYTTIYRSS